MNPIMQLLGQRTHQLPQNDPLFVMVQAYQQGRDPISALEPFASQNPQIANTIEMFRGNRGQMQRKAMEKANELGISVNDIARELGLAFPSKR